MLIVDEEAQRQEKARLERLRNEIIGRRRRESEEVKRQESEETRHREDASLGWGKVKRYGSSNREKNKNREIKRSLFHG